MTHGFLIFELSISVSGFLQKQDFYAGGWVGFFQ